MRIAICDDEKLYIDNIIQHLDFFSRNNNVSFEYYTFTSAADMLECDKRFDIAILDIEMDGMNGIKLGEELKERNRHIILMYITAHKKYLDDALNLNAVRFFEKPLDSQRFYRGLKYAINRIDTSFVNFYLEEKGAVQRIPVQDIIYVEIEKRKTKVITPEKEYHSVNHISFWKEQLTGSMFCSPHKSYIINLNYVSYYERTNVILDNKYPVAIARNNQSAFHKKFMRFMEGM